MSGRSITDPAAPYIAPIRLFIMATTKPKIPIDLEKVESLAANGSTHEEICTILGISERTFYRRKEEMSEMAEAIKRGRERGLAVVENALMKKCRDGNTTAMIFYLVNRGGGKWKSVNRTEITGADGIPLTPPALKVVFKDED